MQPQGLRLLAPRASRACRGLPYLWRSSPDSCRPCPIFLSRSSSSSDHQGSVPTNIREIGDSDLQCSRDSDNRYERKYLARKPGPLKRIFATQTAGPGRIPASGRAPTPRSSQAGPSHSGTSKLARTIAMPFQGPPGCRTCRSDLSTP